MPAPTPTVRPQLEQNRAAGETGAPQPAQVVPSRWVPQLEQNLPAPVFPQVGQGRAGTLMMPRNSCYMEGWVDSPELTECSKDNLDCKVGFSPES